MSLKSFRTFLVEALIDIDKSDIDKIFAPLKKPMKELTAVWNKHFDRFQKAGAGSSGGNDTSVRSMVAQTIGRELAEVISKHKPVYGPLKTIKSSELKSDMAKKAHAVNPVEIHIWLIGLENMSNCYIPNKHEIHICLPHSVANAMVNHLWGIPNYQIPNLKNEVSELKHKSTIRHELTHWIDDSLHNFHITRGVETANKLLAAGKRSEAQAAWTAIMNHGEADIYLSPVEITPMVNQIAEYKRRVGVRKYDSMTWFDLMQALPSLSTLNTKWGAKWRRKMFTRLARENLLGKNFTKKLE